MVILPAKCKVFYLYIERDYSILYRLFCQEGTFHIVKFFSFRLHHRELRMETAASPALQATRSPIHPPNHAQRLRRNLTRRRRRLRQKISLQQINAQLNNLAQLGFGFDALGNNLHAASVCVFHNILDQLLLIRIGMSAFQLRIRGL